MNFRLENVFLSRPKGIAYFFGASFSIACLYIRELLQPFFGVTFPFGFSVLAVVVVAYTAGKGPAILASIIGIAGSAYLSFTPFHSLAVSNAAYVVQICIWLAICLTICSVRGGLRKQWLNNSALTQEVDAGHRETTNILDSIDDPYLLIDSSWRVVQANPACERMYADSRGALVGRNLWEAFPGLADSGVFSALQLVMTERKARHDEVEFPGPGIWSHVRGYPTDVGVSILIHDVTLRREAEASRERLLADERAARNAAEEAGHMKEEFLATLSHELRTPLTPLLGWASILKAGPITPERLAEGLTSIEQSARTQAKMIDELLDISLINSGKLKVVTEFLTLGEVIEEAVSFLLPAAEAKGIDLRFVNEAADLVVRGDSGRLHQVFSNFISNAIRFSESKSQVTVRAFADGEAACFSVTDEGEGIAPPFLPHVFDRFRQADASNSRKSGGLGLGLSIAKRLIQLQGGTVEATSAGLGKGSTFTVCMPRRFINELSHLPSVQTASAVNLSGIRLLLVEDDGPTLLMLTRLLEASGGEVRATNTAAEALSSLVSFKPDIIISDLGMPKVDGYALIRLVRSRADVFKTIPAIALTAYALAANEKSAEEAGFNAFYTKPPNLPVLVEKIIDLTWPTQSCGQKPVDPFAGLSR